MQALLRAHRAVLFLSIFVGFSTQAAVLKLNINDVNCSDTSGQPYCTVEAALAAAVDGDELLLAPGRYPTNIRLSTTPKPATTSIAIIGAGPDQTFIDGGLSTRILIVNYSLSLSNLTLENGKAPSSNASGGAIHMYGISGTGSILDLNLDLNNVVLRNNSARKGGAIGTVGNINVSINNAFIHTNSADEQGGAIDYGASMSVGATQTLTISNSTLSNNSVTVNNSNSFQGGGALINRGQAYIINTTFSGNSVNVASGSGSGGAVLNYSGSLNMTNTTIVNNSTNGDTGGLYNLANLTLENSIVAQNSASGSPSNCSGNSLTSSGYNLFGDTTGCSLISSGSDQLNLSNAQLGLGPLRDNGGPAHSHALAPTSLALNGGAAAAGCSAQQQNINTDQRGAPRDGSCDIGAYEVASDILVYPSQGLITTELGHNALVRLVLASQPTANVQLSLNNSNANEVSLSNSAFTFTPANWDTVQTLTLTGLNDNLQDADQAVQIQLSSSSTDAVYNNLNKTINMSNWHVNEVTAPGFIISPPADLITTEQTLSANFQVTLATPPALGNQVAITAAVIRNGDEAQVSSLTPVLFTNSNWNRAQAISVQGRDDTIQDGNIDYDLQFSLDRNQTTDSLYLNATVAPQTYTLSNLDNDGPNGTVAGITITQSIIPPNQVLFTDEATQSSATFTMVLNTQPTADVLINMVSDNIAEGILLGNPPLFTPANWNIPQTVTVQGVDDTYVDGDKNYFILFDRPSSNDLIYRFAAIESVRLINSDNEVPSFSINAAPNLRTNEYGSTVSFSAQLGAPPQPGTVVFLRTQYDSSEHSISPESLSYDSNNWNQPQNFIVAGVDDATRDGNISDVIRVEVSPASTNASYINAQLSQTLTVINEDNETGTITPGITISEPSSNSTSESGGSLSFSLVLRTQPTADVRIGISSSDTGEGNVSTNSVTFTSLNWSMAQTITVTGVDDTLTDGDVSYSINFADAISTDPDYSGQPVAPLQLTNINDDFPPGLTLNYRSGGLITAEDGTEDFIEVRINTSPLDRVTVVFTPSDNREISISPNPISFGTDEGGTSQTVTVRGADDDTQDGDISYTIEVTTSSNDTAYHALNILPIDGVNQDNDGSSAEADGFGGGGTSAMTLLFLLLILRYRGRQSTQAV